ncbi:MAG TPA: hypothetical protein PLD25_10150 [Chloroflexota bacterium]|nr:hypothetical protein [Chloroflexota bacterium]
MMTAKANILGLLLVSLILGACTAEAIVPATLPPTRTVRATETGTAVAEILVTAVPITATPTTTAATTRDPNQTTDLQTLERAPSTPAPTNTPRPTFTPSPTPTPVFLDLPEWVAAPAVNVLLLGNYDDNKTITLFNADTGEQFEIHVEVNENELSPRWLWQEGHYFLSPTFPEDGQDVIDIETGELVKLADVNDDVRVVVSPDGRYAANITREDRFDIVTLIDQETGSEIELSNPFQDSPRDDYNIYARTYWSPDGALLAVEYEKHYYDDNFDLDLAIYAPSGELFRQYANMNTSSNAPWASILPYRILFTEGDSYLPDRPCILDVIENTQSCLETIAEWVGDRSLLSFTWSPDGSKISFIHWSEEEGNNGLCYFELAIEEIFCPITPDNLLVEEQMVPRAHFWSPDGRYLVLFFDTIGPRDVLGPLGVAVVNNDGQNFQILGLEFSSSSNNPWRPSIPSLSEE